ncbi:M20/M25/M40 family metallo-hydrolase [Rhodothermus profundi]|uniref:Peptidase family M28 n=1 Tax=Rhodothermus profundi TaxID=633813 RepID=A0A1M6WGD8_9BACT|nr:M20/M25/M40 family metallo-hydrolase [Rhodothermus profundi]SHK92674.1 Peptidase family M28 [Rhodothermus profundi]
MKQPWIMLLLIGGVLSVRAQPVMHQPDPYIQQLLTRVSADSIEASIRRLAAFGTRHTLSPTDNDTFGIGAARRWIKQTFERYAAAGGGRMEVFLDRFWYGPDGRRVDRRVEIVNVIARLPGTDPQDDRIFIVSGHYDSRVRDVMDSLSYAPGASDDASGTAAVMEMARVLADARFPATILFVAMAAEEQGLIGARHLAALADSLGWNVAGMFTLDIIGNTEGDNGVRDNRTVRVFSEGVPSAETPRQARLRQAIGGENDSPSRQLARYLHEIGTRYVPELRVKLIFRRDRFLRGGDHIPFNERGFAAVRLTEPHEAYTRQHQDVRVADGIAYGDVPDRIDFDYVARVTRLMTAALANLAMAPPPPAVAYIDARRLSVDTRLLWSPPRAGRDRLAGYYVLVRETTAPLWEQKWFVPATDTSYTFVGWSKDDYFFGIQSVDAQGHESRVLFPVPLFR